MKLWRGVLILAAIVLVALIIRAALAEDMIAAFIRIGDDPWGVVTFSDLYLGFAVTSTLFWIAEPRKLHAAGFIVALLILGNIVSAIWLAWKLPVLAQRLASTGRAT